MSAAHHDPRINHPPRLSDLHGDARRQALIARDRAGREAFMDRYRNPPAKQSFFAKLFSRGAV